MRLGDVASFRERDGPAMVRNEGGLLVGYLYIDVDTATQDLGGYVARGEVGAGALATAAARWRCPPGRCCAGPASTKRWPRPAAACQSSCRWPCWRSRCCCYALFRNVVETLIVLLSIPFALVGSLWALALLNYRLSAAVWIGLIAVVGLAAQTGVVMIVYIDQAYERRRRAGLLRDDEDILAADAKVPSGACAPRS